MIPLFVPLHFFLLSFAVRGQEFGYNGVQGPSHWGENYQGCVGKHQSPINIADHDVRAVTLPLLGFSGFNIPRVTILTNNGHTVIFRMDDSQLALVTGGPLRGTYAFDQLHFHWGKNDREGSEDLINNHSFAMELHAVFYKVDYGSFIEATMHPDGLAVLAYFFEADDETNVVYEPIVQALPNVETVGDKVMLPEPLALDTLLIPESSVIQDYFTYNGSLTTPPCSEVVTWIDFKDPLRLSHRQIAAFRHVRSSEGEWMTHNFRPVQPLEDRFVFHNVPRTGGYSIPRNHEYNTFGNQQRLQLQQQGQYHHHHHSGQYKIGPSALILLATLFVSVR